MSWHVDFGFTGGSWRWRNIQARLIGIAFTVIGGLHFVGGLYWFAVELRMPPAEGRSPATNLVFVCSGLVSLAIGRWLCRRPAYRPDLGDVHPALGKAGGYTAEHAAARRRAARTWWTGDPRPGTHRDRDA